jgi:voltage-gated potassium channel
MNTKTSPPPAPSPRSADPYLRFGKPHDGWRAQLYAIIFESDTPKGRALTWR